MDPLLVIISTLDVCPVASKLSFISQPSSCAFDDPHITLWCYTNATSWLLGISFNFTPLTLRQECAQVWWWPSESHIVLQLPHTLIYCDTLQEIVGFTFRYENITSRIRWSVTMLITKATSGVTPTRHHDSLAYVSEHSSIYVILHYVTVYYVTLHCVTLHYIALRYITLRYVTWHCITLHYVTLCYVTLHYITLCYVMLHYVTVYYVTLHCVTLHNIALHYITLRYVTSRVRATVLDQVSF